ncbi:hypothetical protein CDD82_2727 [Ophiocordyceps australis]|uniref:Uncharacterized protein n=1 Tax=Ophiocordyceps australis TaxID=1399860 RepID=A0A2C5ZHT4_9HYPO|nr:hypothetical protein CDD82_2727 [Ophiocordyceps australis]
MIEVEAEDDIRDQSLGRDRRRPEDLALPFSDSSSCECSLMRDNDSQTDQVDTENGVETRRQVVAGLDAGLEQEPRYVVCGHVYELADKASPPMHLLSLSNPPDGTLLVPSTQPLTTEPTPRPFSSDKDFDAQTEVESFDRLPQGYEFTRPRYLDRNTRVLQLHLGPDQIIVREIYPPRRGWFFWTMLLVAWATSMYCMVAMDRAADVRGYGGNPWELK